MERKEQGKVGHRRCCGQLYDNTDEGDKDGGAAAVTAAVGKDDDDDDSKRDVLCWTVFA